MHNKKVKTVIRNGLQWQTEGIVATYKEAINYIKEQNTQKINGFDDWRLSTSIETLKLIQTEKSLPITQKQFGTIYIWTSSKFSPSRAWVVYFYGGDCSHYGVDLTNYVRAVRSIKSKDK